MSGGSSPNSREGRTSASSRVVELVQRAAGVDGLVGAPFWTDAALVAAAGIPTVLLGPVGEGAHADVEWVDLASLERLHDVVVRVTHAWCG